MIATEVKRGDRPLVADVQDQQQVVTTPMTSEGTSGVYMDQWVSSVGRPRPARSSDLLSLGSFVVLGLPDGMLGTAWPSMRATFGAPVGALGLILLLATAGSVLVTAFVGPLIRRLGVPVLLAVAGAVAALGYTGFAAAPGLWLVLGVSVLLGVSAGMMDAGLNTAVALTGQAAAQPAARRLRRRHRDRPAGRHRRHPHRVVAARLPDPGRPRPGPGRAVAAPAPTPAPA